MTKRRERALVVLMIFVSLGFAAFLVLLAATEARRSKAVVRAKKPKAMEVYEALAAQRTAGGSSSPSAETPGGPPPENPLRPLREKGDGEDANALSTLASFERLLQWHGETVATSEAWRELLDEVLSLPIDEWTGAQRQLLLDFVAEHAGLIAEIRRLAELGGPVYPLDFSVPMYAVELPHLAKLRDCERLLRADALAQELRGNYSGAVEDLVAGLKLGNALEGEPIVISQLVRYAMKGIAVGTITDAFGWGELPPDLARDLLAGLSRGRGREALADALGGEQMMGLDMFDTVSGREELDEGFGYLFENPSEVERAGLWLYSTSVARPWLNMDEQLYMESLERAREVALLPFYEAKPLLDALELDDLPITRVVSRRMLPAIVRIQQARAQSESTADVARVGIALEMYRQERGSYPDRLDAVASYLGGSVPVDTFTGKPFHYTPQGGTFLLYSVGRNLTDDRGRHDLRDGDIVWRGREEE